ncbi:MAG: hypothetical protein LUH05_00005, partial [Candidatus Gastranaerophilales bacterium]|nr:hypothetical protein [Candidatus Gastranaerophilales bacterium]
MPKILNELAGKNFVKKILNENTNTDINFSSVEFKTHINPNITIKLNNLHIKDKENNVSFFNSDYINADIYILPIISKKIRFKQLDAGVVNVNIIRDKDGKFNIEKLFPDSKKTSFKIDYKKSALNINEYNIKSNDEILNQYIEITGSPLKIKSSKKSVLDILTKGQIKSNDNISDFDINMKTKYPVKSNFNSDFFSGSCILYNINLKPFLPFIQSYINKDISDFEGFIDFIQISADKSDDNKINVILNTKFKNLIFNKKDWGNYINANGENKIDANVELYDNTVNFKSFNFKADNVNIKSDGSINFESTPVLNINAEVENSRAENILSILPPNLVPQNMIIQKVKRYGVYGDIEGKVNINGKIPQPDVTGYVKAKNIKTLDKSIHPLHNGSVDITFDKRILNMDILIDFFDNQNAKINGYVYMYRDGINNVTIKTTNNIDFPLAQKIVVPVSKVFNFQIGPIPDMNIKSGKGIIDVNIQGSPDFININGYSSFDKAYLTYNGLFGEILNGKGRLDFKEDVVSFKSERAFVKDNPLTVEGNVRINKDLNFNISSDKAEAKDLLELINKSELLKDVKDGIALITDADGLSKIFVNIKAKIVPVEYGQPPLPPEEAFEDMKVNGFLSLLGNSCYIEGFKIPVEKIKGLVEFTESTVDIHDIEGISGTSPITIGGNIITDLKTKIPDVNITITGKSVNLKDTIKFLTQSYLYPQNYPDLSFLYNIASKHDLYFKYKAKSIDFLTDKAYAVMNFINDETNSALKAKSGKIIMDKANVKVENVIAGLFDSNLTVNGDVKKIDTLNPIYNLTIKTDNFNLKNINNLKQTNIVPDEIENILAQFDSCKGIANIDTAIDKNKLKGNIRFVKPEFRHIKTNTPFIFDDFNIKFNNDSVLIDNVSAKIAEMPFFGNISAENIYKNPNFKGYFTSKVTNDFVKNYLPEEISKRLVLTGDINLSSEFNGNKNNLYIEPKLTLNPEADVITNGASLGEITDKREFNGKININKNEIVIKKLDYVKYVSSQNNTVYPILFATINGILKINEDNLAELEEISIKTYKNLSAKILNMLLNNSFFKQGTFNCDLKYKFNKLQKIPELTGEINCENIDIPLFDILIKNIKLNAKDEVIGLHLFGFLNDSRFN